MSQYPFTLRGRQEHTHGTGLTDSQIQEGMFQRSHEFVLKQRVIIAEIAHHGYGDFNLKFIPTEGVSEGESTAASRGGALGSIISGARTIVGATTNLIGETVEFFTGDDAMWTPVNVRGKCKTICIAQVNEDEENTLSPGKYCIEVTSKDRWTCDFIQPDLGQSLAPMVDNLDQDNMEAGHYVRGPLESGSRPVLANIYHRGMKFYASAYSADGTHRCTVFQETGQFRVEEHQTEIKPGKEYFFNIRADGEWGITFTDGY